MPQQSIAVPGSQVQFQEVMFGSSQLPKNQVHERLRHSQTQMKTQRKSKHVYSLQKSKSKRK